MHVDDQSERTNLSALSGLYANPYPTEMNSKTWSGLLEASHFAAIARPSWEGPQKRLQIHRYSEQMDLESVPRLPWFWALS